MSDWWKVVGVERNARAAVQLKGSFPGLRVIQQPIQSLLRGEGLSSWPDRDEQKWLAAHVVNLDLDKPLSGGGTALFPAIEWIFKFAAVHLMVKVEQWTLCFTINATFPPYEDERRALSACFRDNVSTDEEFANESRRWLREPLYQLLIAGDDLCAAELDYEEAQRILLILVPKLIGRRVVPEGWRLDWQLNLGYGGREGEAPMASWVVRMEHLGGTTLTEPYQASNRQAIGIAMLVSGNT